MDKTKLAREFYDAGIELPFLLYGELDSTNNFAKTVVPPCVVIARKQTAGRGRGHKTFVSEAGGLYFSIALAHGAFDKFNIPLSGITERMPLVCGIAVAEALGSGAYVKWPNDVYLCNDVRRNCLKVCGILCENTADRLVIGTGVNVNTENFPDDLKEKATSLAAFHNKKYDMEQLCAKIVSAVLRNIADKRYFENSGFLQERFSRFDMLNGRDVILRIGDKLTEGVAAGVDNSGKLQLFYGGKLHSVNCGEIEFAGKK